MTTPDSSLLASYDYPLPEERIAQRPVEPRSAARLLVAPRGGAVEHRTVADLPDLLGAGDVLVVNETRVLPARLRLRKRSGGAAEVLLLEPAGDGCWRALVRPGRRLPPGTELVGADGRVVVEVEGPAGAVEDGAVADGAVEDGAGAGGAAEESGARFVRVVAPVEDHGVVPLPPYIREPLADPGRYQTVYARTPGSVAAPTAGLHLTEEVLDGARARGVDVHTVDLAVGLDTFRPITSAALDDHRMHTERYTVPAATMAACRGAEGRVVAVGTTTVRALESAARPGGSLEGRTDLFIRPGFRFEVVDRLLTNFHLPRSSLLVLLAAFAGEARWRELYEVALRERYRFLSFGDAMLVDRA